MLTLSYVTPEDERKPKPIRVHAWGGALISASFLCVNTFQYSENVHLPLCNPYQQTDQVASASLGFLPIKTLIGTCEEEGLQPNTRHKD